MVLVLSIASGNALLFLFVDSMNKEKTLFFSFLTLVLPIIGVVGV